METHHSKLSRGYKDRQEEYMPLWDSVQRGLEKATQEATRIAKTQRLRATIDGLSRQINAQNSNILNKCMELFLAGQLTQAELLPLCQEMVSLQQHLAQAQAELKQLQASQAQSSGTQPGAPNLYLSPETGGPAPYPSMDEALAPTVYVPPPAYQSYLDSTNEYSVPPPPPGVEPTVSSIDTIRMNWEVLPSAPRTEPRLCTVCRAELPPGNAFCHNCGAPVQDNDSEHLPTVRAGNLEPFYPGGQETMRSDTPVTPVTPVTPSPPSPQLPITGASDAGAKENEGV